MTLTALLVGLTAATSAASNLRPRLVYDGAFLVPKPYIVYEGAVAPNGAWIALPYVGEDDDNRLITNVALVDPRHPRQRRVAVTVDEIAGIAWSPDSRSLLVASKKATCLVASPDGRFVRRTITHLPVRLAAPILFSARGEFALARRPDSPREPGAFVLLRFPTGERPSWTNVRLHNEFEPALIRYPGNRIAVVGEGRVVDGDGVETRVKSAGTTGLYNVHSNPFGGGRWFVTFDMDTEPRGETQVFVVTGTKAWLEDVVTGKRWRLAWPKDLRVSMVATSGPSSICVQATDESLLAGHYDRFRRYHLVWERLRRG